MQLPLCRYAGRGFERAEDQKGPGILVVKGLKSMWRQAAPIVRSTLQGSLKRIIMQASLAVHAVNAAKGDHCRRRHAALTAMLGWSGKQAVSKQAAGKQALRMH